LYDQTLFPPSGVFGNKMDEADCIEEEEEVEGDGA
jgi:hypothetical protein